jgi:hypothetical protein
MQTPVEPGEQFVLNLVVNGERDLCAVWTNFSEINDAHQSSIPAHGLKRILFGRIAVDRQKDRVRLKTEWAAKAEIHGFGRCHCCTRHHQELTPI